MTLADKQPGERLTAREVNDLSQDMRQGRIVDTDNLLGFSTTPGAMVANPKTYTKLKWVFVTGVTASGDKLIGYEARRSSAGTWSINRLGPRIVALPAPNFRTDVWEQLILVGDQPTDKDQLSQYDGMYIWPVWRMLPVDPAPLADLCQPPGGLVRQVDGDDEIVAERSNPIAVPCNSRGDAEDQAVYATQIGEPPCA